MRRSCLLAIFLVAACGESAVPEAAEEKAAPRPALQPLALSAFERSAVSTVQRARSEQAARDLEAKAKRAMQAYLFDPFSARFRNLRAGGGGAVCGQYNAKNRLGAYVGFRDFVVSRDGRQLWTSSYNDGVRSEMYGGFAEAYVNACASRAEATAHRAATQPYTDYEGYSDMNATAATEYGAESGARSDFYAAEEGYEAENGM